MALLDKRVETQTENITVRISKEAADRLRLYAKAKNRTNAEVVEWAVIEATTKDKSFIQSLQAEHTGNAK